MRCYIEGDGQDELTIPAAADNGYADHDDDRRQRVRIRTPGPFGEYSPAEDLRRDVIDVNQNAARQGGNDQWGRYSSLQYCHDPEE